MSDTEKPLNPYESRHPGCINPTKESSLSSKILLFLSNHKDIQMAGTFFYFNKSQAQLELYTKVGEKGQQRNAWLRSSDLIIPA